MKKTIFITGASSGLGKATARLFHERGWNIIATMRNPENEKELTQLENVTILALDVTDADQIKQVAEKAIALASIDVVFNNAGYGLMGALEALSDAQIERQISTNLMGVIRVTKAFVPYFRSKKSGLFISTTSMGGLLTFPLHSIYHAAKFAIEGWSESMSYELSLHHIGIKTIAPGAFATDFLGRSLDRANHPDYKPLEDKLFSGIDGMMNQATAVELIAEVVFEAATDGKDQVNYLAGEDAKSMHAHRVAVGAENFRKEIKGQFSE